MRCSSLVLAGIVATTTIIPLPAQAQSSIVRKGVSELVEFFTKAGARQSAKELAEIGGEKAVREVIEKAAAEGGDDLIRQIVSLAKSSGPRALKALEGDPALMTRALRSLPEGKVADAVIEASRQPALMAKLVRVHGDDVLTASARHPGIGTKVIDEFGGAGLKATKDLTTDEVISLAKVKGFRELPQAVQGKFMALLDRDPKAVMNLLLLTGGGTAIILSADLVNKLEGQLVGKDGKPGPIIRPIITYSWIIGGMLAAAIAAYVAIKLWGAWRKTKGSTGAVSRPDAWG
jgi:hypothetical protein